MEMRNIIGYLGYFLLIVAIGFLMYKNYKINCETDNKVELIKNMDKKNKVHTTIYYDQVIGNLKKANKKLYDSIKSYKNQVDYLVQFKYNKKYKIDTVFIDTIKKENEIIKTFEYNNSKNDTLNYNLKIGSTTVPKWYSLDLSVSDNFTIINKKEGNLNVTEISSQNKGDIDEVTVFNKKKKKSIFKKIAIGPSVSFGYDFAKKEPEFLLGVSITYNIFGN